MNECRGRKFILNGKIIPSDYFDNSLVYEGDSIYEVIRMVKGAPVFFHDHVLRLESSTFQQGRQMLANESQLRSDIIKLVKAEREKEINLKIVFNYKNNIDNYLVYFIESVYPSGEQYKSGVKGILFKAERKNPASKVINHKLRSSVHNKLILESAYEALLVNEENCITEGSRSNIFFVKENTISTAQDDKVLSGITRKHIIDLCRVNKISLEYKCVPVSSLHEYDSVFMTGTSPMVLPFYTIDDIPFKVNLELIETLRNLYIRKALESVDKFLQDK